LGYLWNYQVDKVKSSQFPYSLIFFLDKEQINNTWIFLYKKLIGDVPSKTYAKRPDTTCLGSTHVSWRLLAWARCCLPESTWLQENPNPFFAFFYVAYLFPTLSFILQICSIFFYTQSNKILLFSSIHNLINSTCINTNTFISGETRWIRHHYLNQSKLSNCFFNITTCLTTFDCILGKAQPFALSPRTIVLEKVNSRKSL
jgi:hypothetical protein